MNEYFFVSFGLTKEIDSGKDSFILMNEFEQESRTCITEQSKATI